MPDPTRPHMLVSTLARAAVLCCVAAVPLALAPGATASASPAGAPAAPGVTPVDPGPDGYFTYTLPPGATATGSVVVRDQTAAAATYDVYVASAKTSPVGGVAYGQPSSLPPGTSWVRLSTAAVSVPPEGSAPVDFSVTVPAGTAPGDYMVGLVSQTPQPTAVPVAATGDAPGLTLLTTTRVIIAVVVRVPGPATAAASFGAPSVSLQQHRRQVLTIPIDDTGSLLMKPYLSGDLRSCSGGSVVLRLARQLGTFVPRTSIQYPWYMNGQVLPAGCYRATLALDGTQGGVQLASYSGTLQVGTAATAVRPSTGQGQPSSAGLRRWLVPASGAALLLLVLTLLLLLRARNDRRRLLERLARSAASSPVRQW